MWEQEGQGPDRKNEIDADQTSNETQPELKNGGSATARVEAADSGNGNGVAILNQGSVEPGGPSPLVAAKKTDETRSSSKTGSKDLIVHDN